MKPIVTVEEMRAIDAASPVAESELIHRAAWAVSRSAIRMMGGTYGRRATVIAGPGNNGADGRRAARFLEDRGVRVSIVAPGEIDRVPPCDLVIDAAYGTGFHGEYVAPWPDDIPVLAVDIPSGVNGNTGIACHEDAVKADRTVTFAAYKPGHFLADGPDHCGEIELCDIGLDVSSATMHLFTEDEFWVLPDFGRESHKWRTALGVVAGSPGMMGAASFVVAGAQRAGAGMVRLLSPGVSAADGPVGEAVVLDGLEANWSHTIGEVAPRLQAMVIGPGLGRREAVKQQVRAVVEADVTSLVLDADGLFAVGDTDGLALLAKRMKPTVLTPHDGEFKMLTGGAPDAKRYESVRALAKTTNSVVLLKGSTTLVADDEHVIFVTSGDARLATAGTGDVLSGIVGAFLAMGAAEQLGTAAAAYVHGAAAKNSYSKGLIASDLPENVAKWLSEQLD